MNGTTTYNLNVVKDYLYRWEEVSTKPDGGKLTTVKYEFRRNEQNFQDSYPISYWLIGHMNIYGLENILFKNYALPNEQVKIENLNKATASGNHNPNKESHVFPKNC